MTAMNYMCVATREWKSETSSGSSLQTRSRSSNLMAANEEDLYECMATFRAMHERIEGEPNPDDRWEPVLEHEDSRVKFGPILRVEELSPCLVERIEATRAWSTHASDLAAYRERQVARERERLERKAERDQHHVAKLTAEEKSSYLRVKARLDVGGHLSG